ncbi:MAG: hypothetical protein WBW55_12300 [Desulfobaccales bacterium]
MKKHIYSEILAYQRLFSRIFPGGPPLPSSSGPSKLARKKNNPLEKILLTGVQEVCYPGINVKARGAQENRTGRLGGLIIH